MNNGNQTQLGEPAQSDSFLEKQRERHKELSITIRRTMFTMLAYSATCAVIIFQPDVPFVLTSSGVKIPLLNVAVSLKAFLIFGPVGQIVVTGYLHLFIAKLDRITGIEEYDKQPFLFNFQDNLSRLLKFFIFYAIPPMVMLGFAWKAAVNPEWLTFMFFATVIVVLETCICPFWKLKWLFLLFLVLSFFAFLVLSVSIDFFRWDVHRPLNLERAQLNGTKFGGISLKGANLWLANLREADLRRAYLREANLSGADLREANLRGASLFEANLSGADLRKAELNEDSLTNADLHRVDMREMDLSGFKLSRTVMIGADLRKVNLRKANLSYADLGSADLREANLSGADLQAADLSGANLFEANLSGADLRKADLNRANLVEARGYSIKQLCEAKTLYEANLSPELIKLINKNCPEVLKVQY